MSRAYRHLARPYPLKAGIISGQQHPAAGQVVHFRTAATTSEHKLVCEGDADAVAV